ncbi:MAG: hypothetical protein V1882_02745 [Candidatus Omnitrophota bacterium]
MIITERDTEILKMCLEQKFLLLRQIAKRFFPESGNVYKVPARRVNLLMKHGYLRAVKPRVSHETLYLTTSSGVKYLKSLNLSSGLRPLRNVDLKTYEHDVWVTEVRIIMEEAWFEWTSERVLRKEAKRQKVPDGMIFSGDRYSFLVEVERTLKNKRYYERMFHNNWMHYKDNNGTLFIVGKRTMIQWFQNFEHCERFFYFASISDLFDRKIETEFSDKDSDKIIPYRYCDHSLGGPEELGPRFYANEAEYLRVVEEAKLKRLKKGGAVSDPSGS